MPLPVLIVVAFIVSVVVAGCGCATTASLIVDVAGESAHLSALERF